MIIHSPIISGSLTFAQGATMVSSNSGVSGSFSGSFQGDGSQLTNVAASGLNIDLLNEGPITGNDYILFSDQSDSGTEKRATLKTALDSEGVFSGSAQVQGEVGGHLIPVTHNTFDLGSTTKYWRDLYLSSGSLYINGQQVLSTTGTELRITTDAGESIKILEAGNDTITLETENGDITLTASGTGNIELDAPIQVGAGNQILSSDGNAIIFGEEIDAGSNRISANNIGNVAGTSTFTGSFVGDGTSLSGVTSYTDADNTAHLNSLAVVSGSASEVRTFINVEDGADVTDTANVKTALNASLGGTQTIGDSSDTITIAGNLTVSGTTTTVNSNTVSIGDNIIILNSDESGTPSQNGGIEIERGTSDNVVFQFNEGTDRWQFTNDGSTYFNLPTSTADITENTNLYYTDARVKTKLDADGVLSGSTSEVRSLINVEDGATADQTGAEIKTALFNESDTNNLTDTLLSKLNAIEASADVTDATNVTAAGALMDSEVTNLSEVKAFDSSDYATAAQGTLADSAQQPPSEGAFVDGDKTKLDGIETGADVTDSTNVEAAGALMDSELTDLAGVKGVTISDLQPKPSEGAFANGDKTKLDGIEASADVTDTANVTSAGALMDSEVTDLDGIKSLTVPNDTTISTFGASLVDDANAGAARTTLGLGTSDTVEFGIVSASTDLYFEGNLIGSSTSTGSFGRLEVNASTIKIGDQEIGETQAETLNNASGTNTGDVTLAGSYDYLSISGQEITLGQVDAAADISNLTTSNVSEGTNEYFTEARAQSALSGHTDSTTNPHSVTATQVGLGNVTNESKATMFADAALTGNPTAPTQTGTDDSTKIATTAFVQDRIDTIIGTAGSTLDTLGELSASLDDDQDALTALTTTVGSKLAKSSNLSDLTDAASARTNLGVDAAGTDNSTDVSLVTTSHDYLSLSGQAITLGQIDISDDTNLAVSDTTGQTGIDMTLSGDTLSAAVSGLGTSDTVQFGTVGIGTDSPTKNLHIASSNSDTAVTTGNGLSGGETGDGLLIANTDTTAGTYANLDFRANNVDARIAVTHNATNNGDFHFILDNTTATPQTRLVIKGETGNVGIGTDSPDSKLHVEDSSAGAGVVLKVENTGADGAAQLDLVNDAQSWFVNTRTDDKFSIYNNTASTTALTIDTSNNVGIGTDNPGAELDVSGDIRATGDVVAFASSDERLKDNVELISNPIEKVKELRGVTWEWNEEASDIVKQTPNVGVIAQEVEKVLPELVHDRENGYKGVDYSKLTGLLIEVVKTQQEKIESLESRLDKLEN